MKYVFDTSSLKILFNNFYPDNFPTLWNRFNKFVSQKRYFSVKEVRREFDYFYGMEYLIIWSKKHSYFFLKPDEYEDNFMSHIFTKKPHFRGLVKNKNILSGKPVADPFVIAKAKALKGCVVTEEKYKENSAKIPNVCEYFNISCTNLKGFMKKEKWKF